MDELVSAHHYPIHSHRRSGDDQPEWWQLRFSKATADV